MDFIRLRICPSMPTFWRVFINGCWILSKAFSASIEMIIRFLSFNLLIWYITLIDLHMLKNLWIPRLNPTWLWYIILQMCCWILFGRTLLNIFAPVFSVTLAYNFLFYLFWYYGDGGFGEWDWEFFSRYNILEQFEWDWC